jgi:translocation and assembly module TamB
MVSEIERITGGRAEIGSFHTIPFQMRVEVRDVTVRGSEAANDVPLAHADSLMARLKLISLLRTEFGFTDVVLERPVIHVAFYPDGTTNVPGAQLRKASTQTPIQKLFALSIDHLDVRHGELLWSDKKILLDFEAHDTALQMDYALLHSRYEGRLLIGKVDSKFDDFRPFAWMSYAEFTLGSDNVEVKLLKLNSGRTRLEAQGKVNNLRQPQVEGSYEASIDLSEVASISRRRDLREGAIQFKGRGKWSLEQFATTGKVDLHDLGWRDEQISLNKARATADYSITDNQIRLSKLDGTVLGGVFTGDAQIDNWLHSAPARAGYEEIASVRAARPLKTQASKKAEKPLLGVQTGAIHLGVRDLSAEETAAVFNTPAHPLGHFRASGFASGGIDARWRGSPRDADVTFALEMNPPLHAPAGGLPVTASLQGTYQGSRQALELSKFNVTTPSSHVQASGTLSTSSSLRFSVSTSNLDELRPLIAVVHGPAKLPFNVNGNATLSGVISGTPSAPAINGLLTARDFDFTLAATSRTPQQQVHWDSLSASVQLSPQIFALRNGHLERGDTNAEFEFSANLQEGQFTDESPLNGRVNLHNVDIAAMAALAGYDYPVTGTADLFLQLTGSQANLVARGKVHATNASLYGESIAQFDSDVQLAGTKTELHNIHLFHDDAMITGNAAYDIENRAFWLDLIGKNFDLSRVPQIQSRLSIGGRADFDLQGSGKPESPMLNGSVHVRNLRLGQQLEGGLELSAVTKGNELHLTGHSEFPVGSIVMDGDIHVRDRFPASISFKMDHLELDPLWQAYLGGIVGGHSEIAGSVSMQGPLRDPRRWKVKGDFSGVALNVESVGLHNQDPVRLTYADQSLNLDLVHLVGEGTNLTARGSINLNGSRKLDLVASGQLDLKLLNVFDPDMTASGLMSVDMTIGGTIAEPFPQGRVKLSNGAVTYVGLPSGLSEMNGSLVFNQNSIHIETLSARTGGGTLDLSGDATAYTHQLNFNVTAVGKDVRLRYPPGVSSTANAELRWVGTRSASTVSGDILVTKLAVTPNFDFSSYLERSRRVGSTTPANSPLYGVKLDIHVQTAPELQMKTAVARLSGDADLRLRGSVASPSVLGRADILEGEAKFNGTRFRLERGDITFADPVTITPQVNLQASTHVRNYDLDITVIGTPDRLAVNYRSEPPLPQSDIIALLALGRTSQESEQLQQQSGQTLFTNEASAMIINEAINSTVNSRIQKLFGASRIKIDPQGLTTETNPTARGPQVTIEQQFANNVSLTYSTNVAQSTEQIIQGQYFFTRNISVVGTRDQNGVVSFDVRVRRQKQ